MKKIMLILIWILYYTTGASAQILNPVKWSYAAKKVSRTEAVVFLKATIDEGWHIYSQYTEVGGPVKTSFTFDRSKFYTVNGKTSEPKPITRFENAFRMDVSYFEGSVIFQQRIKLTGKGPQVVKGNIEFMTCNDEKCLPPDNVNFSIPIN